MKTPSTFSILIGGRTLEFPVVPLADASISIALFDSLGDLALCDFLAGQLIAGAQARGIPLGDIDVILTAGKAITLADSVARKLGLAALSIAEKKAKHFWPEPYGVASRSITGGEPEQLVVGGRRAQMLMGKRILVIDDVISSGESIHALLKIARHFGFASLVMASFVEGNDRDMEAVEGVPAIVLGRLPVWRQ